MAKKAMTGGTGAATDPMIVRASDLLAFFGPLHAWKIAPDGSVNDNVLLNSPGVS
jgi:hypothetical protein